MKCPPWCPLLSSRAFHTVTLESSESGTLFFSVSTFCSQFEHIFAIKAFLDGVPINVLQKWLAHSSLAMTTVYADVLGMDTSDFMRGIK